MYIIKVKLGCLDFKSIITATTRLKIDASNCDGPQKTVIDDSKNRPNITSHCNCEIKSNFTGELFFTSNHSCSPGFHVFDDNGKIIDNICDNKRAHFRKNVFTGDSLKLVLINNSSNQSENLGEIVQIYARDNSNNGLFSVTCGSESDSITRITRPTLVAGTFEAFNKGIRKSLPTRSAINNVTSVAERETYGSNFNASKSEFPYIYAVVAGCIVVVAIIIFVFICKRRKNRAQNTCNEERKEAGTYNNATNGIERPENVDPSKHLPDNPLYHSYQVNDDSGYSTCGNENLVSIEQLPDNPLYHSYQENEGKEDSKNEIDDVGTLPLQDCNAVYAQPNKLTRTSNVNQDDPTESQIENVYAQINKTKKT
uniref:Uncharacterized protein LOC111103182 isoform X3 n=1 Tax=Crassostrea virginica TaxID=6565 RepID=A0A8B8ALF1_CRAVI|nr:uncharacterized protein LOC111103182 isoform X3 [Crassostrea virginica]